MGFRFRKSIGLGKGLRLNIGRRGVGLSAGVPGLRWSANTSGRTSRSIGLPGTGLSHVTTGRWMTPGAAAVGPPDSPPPVPGGGSILPSGVPEPPPSAGWAEWVRNHKLASAAITLAVLTLIGMLGGEDSDKPERQEITPLIQQTTAAPEPVIPEPTSAAPAPVYEPVVPATTAPAPAQAADPNYGSCAEAKRNGGGPYYRDKDPEYHYYEDRDGDGVVCE